MVCFQRGPHILPNHLMNATYPVGLLTFGLTLAVLVPSQLVAAQDSITHTYQMISGSFTWHQAKADAEARGGHLATITSPAEIDSIRSLNVTTAEPYWLGATDEGHEGPWPPCLFCNRACRLLTKHQSRP